MGTFCPGKVNKLVIEMDYRKREDANIVLKGV